MKKGLMIILVAVFILAGFSLVCAEENKAEVDWKELALKNDMVIAQLSALLFNCKNELAMYETNQQKAYNDFVERNVSNARKIYQDYLAEKAKAKAKVSPLPENKEKKNEAK